MENNWSCFLGTNTTMGGNIFRMFMFLFMLIYFQYFILQGSLTILYWFMFFYIADKWELILKHLKG